MTPKILGENYADRIRARLGVKESHLSVEEIDEVLPEIEAQFCELVPDWEEIISSDSDKKTFLQSAVVCKTASVLCSLLKLKYPVKEQGAGGSFEVSVDWDGLMVKLESDSNRFLYKLIPLPVYPRFQVF